MKQIADKEVNQLIDKAIKVLKKGSKLKCYVLIVSRNFPKAHPKAGEYTHFFESIESGIKLHTIRGNYELWKKRIDEVNAGKAYISRRYWSAVPYDSKQVEYDRLYKAGIQPIWIDKYGSNQYAWQIEDKKCACHLWDIAKNDGLSYEDFQNWFFKSKTKGKFLVHGEFSGGIIHFTNFRY